jgi:hypothetical protein
MKEESKLRPFVYPMEVDVVIESRLDCEHSKADICLYKLFLQKHSERVPIDGIVLKVQAVQLNNLLGWHERLKVSEGWLWGWKVCHGMCLFNTECDCASETAQSVCICWVH